MYNYIDYNIRKIILIINNNMQVLIVKMLLKKLNVSLKALL